MITDFWPILVQFLFALGFAIFVLGLAHLIKPKLKKASEFNPDTFECGISPTGDARGLFHIKFYMVAVLFIIFDIEAIFLFPWAVTFLQFKSLGAGGFILIEMFIFLFILILGYFYIIKKGGLSWDNPN